MISASKIIAGNKVRKSRLHDEKGNFVGWRNITKHGIRAFFSGILRVIFNVRPEKPWISYSAISYLSRKLTKQSAVLEFGSGMSTIWYAKHAGEVFSIEDNPSWHKIIKDVLQNRSISTVTYSFAENEEDYTNYMAGSEKKFDLIMVDGSYRSKCIVRSINLLKPGGILYLDNSDKDSTLEGGDMRHAEMILRDYAKKSGSSLTSFTDFAPTQLFVQQGLMLESPL